MTQRVKTTNDICKKILREITPRKKERVETLRFSQKLTEKLTTRLQQSGIRAEVQVQGSIAKGTWLAGDKDIDIFISVPKSGTKEAFQRVLEVVKSLLGQDWTEAYAEHPYIEAKVEEYKIDFVPCFKIERAEDGESAVDRTPLHTAYIKKHLNQNTKSEVLLLKKFMQGIGAYGAEIRIKGFSGYLCELLVLHYGSFLKVLQGMTVWQIGQVVDIENFYKGQINEIQSRFSTPLVVIDPIDASRNVAAAVSKERFGEVLMASRLFLEKPNVSFFVPSETIPLSSNALRKKLEGLGYDLVFVVFGCKKTVSDIIWGELYKTMHALRRILSENGFQVFRDAVWSDESKVSVLLFGLETKRIPASRRHLGPPIDSGEAVKFVEKYTKRSLTEIVVTGPWIEGDRWVVVVRRRIVDADSMLREKFRNDVKNLGVANNLVEGLRTAEVYVNAEILDVYSTKREFTRFLTDFLKGRPTWMG